MNIELIDTNKVLFDLCQEDMQLLSIEYTTLNLKSQESIYIIRKLIKIASNQIGFSAPNHSTAFVEAMPYDGGCFILITLNKENFRGKKFRIIKRTFSRAFIFSSCENMLCAIEKLREMDTSNYLSTMVFHNNFYYLIITSSKKIRPSIYAVLTEYSQSNFIKPTEIAHILEFGNVIISNNAIEKVGGAMCR